MDTKNEELMKSSLFVIILNEIRKRDISNETICGLLDISQQELTWIEEKSIRNFSMCSIFKLLNALNRDIYITIFPAVEGKRGKIHVGHFDVEDDDTDSYLANGGMKSVADIYL